MEICKKLTDWVLTDGNDGSICHASGIPQEKAIPVELPHFTHMTIPDHVGIAWYESKITLDELPEDVCALLCFECAVFRTEVSVNGILAGEHIGVEDPFSFDITTLLHTGENRITVRTSKPHEEPVDGFTLDEIPHRNQAARGLRPGWCYNESGLAGEVTLKLLPRVYIADLWPVPDCGTGEIRVECTVCNTLAKETELTLTLEARRMPDGDAEDFLTLKTVVQPGESVVRGTLRIPEPALWSTEDPNLYSVRAAVTGHSLQKKCGFRTFVVGDDGYFRLNGKRVYVKCSHTGNCFPESAHFISRDRELLRRDFLMAKSTGFNMIRFISGAALPLQMDLCDEIGLMLYIEPTAGWCSRNGEHTAELYKQDLFSMIRRDRAHPSVVIWGLLNETTQDAGSDIVCHTARDILPELRKWDDTRLVLYSSGRWDKDPAVGSVSNPGKKEWQYLWGFDGEGLSPDGDLGDIHYYPNSVPLRKPARDRMRRFGEGTARPVFMSESGVGSALDTVQLTRKFMETDAMRHCPDVQMVFRMNEQFCNELTKFGFDNVVPMPSELMRGSMQNHVYYRTQAFDQLRGNPRLCGISLTGLLDHSICGEGLWTLHRRFKPGIADVLQDGFASLRWNLFPSAPALFRGDVLEVEGSIASEDVLKAGSTYTAVAGLFAEDGYPYDVRTYTFTVTEEMARTMVVPVFRDTWDTADLEPGRYTCKAELLEADAAGGIRTVYICDRVSGSGEVWAAGISAEERKLLAGLGLIVRPLTEYAGEGVILAGHVDEELAGKLRKLAAEGAHVIALRAAEEADAALTILPENRRPAVRREADWLYHRETVLRPRGRFFAGMQTGLCDAHLYTDMITGVSLDAEGDAVPDVTDAIAFETGYPDPKGFLGGYKLGSFHIGKGELLINTFSLLDTAGTVPAAARLLVNLCMVF